MLRVEREDTRLLLVYWDTFFDPPEWVDAKLKADGKITLHKVFTVRPKHKLKIDDLEKGHEMHFLLGRLDNGYYVIPKDILGLDYDLKLCTELSINLKTFKATRDISVFRRVEKIIQIPIIVGGGLKNAIPTSTFTDMLVSFPTTTEVDKYALSRICRVLKDGLDFRRDAELEYEQYLNRKKTPKAPLINQILIPLELQKYELMLETLTQMLVEASSYQEKDWQRQITGFILLLFPKYLRFVEQLPIRDSTSTISNKYKKVDFALLDTDGNVDIIEIKRPHAKLLAKTPVRSNFVPHQDLSSTVMQTEKYLYHLNRWGVTGEAYLNTRYAKYGHQLKITNSKGMLILGRSHNHTEAQALDFEVIKRNYKNIADILTYDDLINRLKRLIENLKKQNSN